MAEEGSYSWSRRNIHFEGEDDDGGKWRNESRFECSTTAEEGRSANERGAVSRREPCAAPPVSEDNLKADLVRGRQPRLQALRWRGGGHSRRQIYEYPLSRWTPKP